jgi:hypothetical protein
MSKSPDRVTLDYLQSPNLNKTAEKLKAQFEKVSTKRISGISRFLSFGGSISALKDPESNKSKIRETMNKSFTLGQDKEDSRCTKVIKVRR